MILSTSSPAPRLGYVVTTVPSVATLMLCKVTQSLGYGRCVMLNAAVIDRQKRQVPAAPAQIVSRPASRFGEIDTATVVRLSILVMTGQSHPIATVVIQV